MIITKKTAILLSLIIMALLVPISLVSDQALNGGSEQIYAKWEWRDASITSVFDHLAMVSGVDIVVDQGVTGELSLTLRNKSWQDVFRVICSTNELHYEIEDEYIFVNTERAHIDRLVQQSQSERNLENVEQLKKVIVNLQYTNANEMQTPVQGLLSQRGRVTVVEHTNSLIIDDLPSEISSIRAMIDTLDREMLQISISTKIVEVSSGNQNNIGIQWSFFDNTTGAQVAHLPTPTKGEGILANSLEKITYGILDQSGFSIAMDYLFVENNSEVVAEPQITTVENKEAHIFMGSRIPISSLDYAGNTKVEMIDAGTELTVTPRVTGDGRVKLLLEPSKKSFELSDEGPIIHEQGAETEVIVQDGQTVVIAGLTSNDQHHTEGGIPFLKDIPILGYLFKTESNREDKKDLVIFVTPHIVKTTALNLLTDVETPTTVHVDNGTENSDDDFSVE